MKSGPTLKACTVSPRRRNASSRLTVTVVLPTPLATPAMTSTRGFTRLISPGSSREDRLTVYAPGQVSWLSDRPNPRAFPALSPVALAGFVPDHSDGVAADSHRLPWAPVGTLGASNGCTLAKSAAAGKGVVEQCTRCSSHREE